MYSLSTIVKMNAQEEFKQCLGCEHQEVRPNMSPCDACIANDGRPWYKKALTKWEKTCILVGYIRFKLTPWR